LVALASWLSKKALEMTHNSKRTGGVSLQFQALSKSFGERQVLKANTLSIEPGEFIAIVGRSGCGKSTLLRLVAGLETPTFGQLKVDGLEVQGLRPDTRIMFQDSRLLPWRRVLENVALGLPHAQRDKAATVLVQVGLGDRLQEWPAKLSGGQRQRVALARALVHSPNLLLLDEPLGALDALTRIEMHALIEQLWRDNGFTFILIEDGAIALDERVHLPRPRGRGDARFAAIEKRILDRVLQQPTVETAAANDDSDPNVWPTFPRRGLRWAV